MLKERRKSLPDTKRVRRDKNKLIIYNDEINTFDFVIETLVDVCDLNPVQAEQCATIIHYRGKDIVLSGAYNYLKMLKDELVFRGLKVEII